MIIGINVMGFYADVMHMARLWDTARDKSTAGEKNVGERMGWERRGVGREEEEEKRRGKGR